MRRNHLLASALGLMDKKRGLASHLAGSNAYPTNLPHRLLISGLGALFLAGCPTPNPPTFHKDVEPILVKSCNNCHIDGGIAPFALTSFQDAFEHGTEIQIQTEAKLMPPWHIQDDGGCQDFLDSRVLTDQEIETIRLWFEAGMPQGDPADAPPPPPPPPTIDRIDAVADMNVDYEPDITVADDYRCFLMDPGLVTDKFLTAYEVNPGTPEIVHHMILFAFFIPPGDPNGLANAQAAQAEAEALDGADGRPGYTCFGDARVDALPIVAWAPGINLQKMPQGTGVRLPAGFKVIMQVHYNTLAIDQTQPIPTDRTSVDLKLEDEVGTEMLLLLFGRTGGPEVIPPGLDSFQVVETLNMNDLGGIPLRLHGVLPHMHLRGTDMRFEVARGGETGEKECLANVPDWDFHWQQAYFYDTPLLIQPADFIRLECNYDTSDEVSPISFGEGTEDEMCLMGTYLSLPFNLP